MYISWRHGFCGVCGGIDVVVVYHEYFMGEMDFAGVYHELLTLLSCQKSSAENCRRLSVKHLMLLTVCTGVYRMQP